MTEVRAGIRIRSGQEQLALDKVVPEGGSWEPEGSKFQSKAGIRSLSTKQVAGGSQRRTDMAGCSGKERLC